MHRARLRFLIYQYKTAVETLLDDQDLDSFERVEEALRPLVLLNERLATRAPTQGDEDDAELDDLLVDLDAELDGGEDELDDDSDDEDDGDSGDDEKVAE